MTYILNNNHKNALCHLILITIAKMKLKAFAQIYANMWEIKT